METAAFERSRALERGVDADLPASFARRRIAESEIAAGSNERTFYAELGDDSESFISGVAFRDATDVELHTGSVKENAVVCGIKVNFTEASPG